MAQVNTARFYYDILIHILDFSRDDYGQLFQYALVNREFNQAASSMLYSRVVLSPPPSRLHQLNLRDTGSITSPSNLPSASLPRYAPLVLELEVSGFLSPRPPPRNTLSPTLSEALQKFTHIRSVNFAPLLYHEDVFLASLRVLPSLPSLQELAVNASCMDDAKVGLLAEVRGLRRLSLCSPTRAVLQLLPEWLGRNSQTLRELHLLDNCGSVTPGVLKAFLPHVQETLKAFSLGLSYSVTDEDLFSFLSQLPNLERLQLRNYWQLKAPIHKPGLRRLREFTARHPRLGGTRPEVDQMCKWIRRIIADAPIESLQIVVEGEEEADEEGASEGRAHPAFDALVDHLVKKHAGTLRELRMKSAFVGLDALRGLWGACRCLERFHVSGGKAALALFAEVAPTMPNLHTAAFEIRNVKRGKVGFGKEQVAEVIRRGTGSLRRFAVNGVYWEGSWKLLDREEEEKEIGFAVEEVHWPVPPWRRQNSEL